MELVAGDAQVGVVGKELPNAEVVRVLDAQGLPIKGQLVNFRVVEGGGTTFAGSSITDDRGVAQERWTLGTNASVAQQLEARAVNNATGSAIVYAVFHCAAKADAAVQVTPVGSNQTVAAGSTPTTPVGVLVQDQYGNPVPATAVHFTVVDGDGSITAADVATDANGHAFAAWAVGPYPGPNHLRADSIGLTAVVLGASSTGYAPGTCPPATPDVCGGATSSSCTNLLTDSSNCGLCGRACLAGSACSSGACTASTDVLFVVDDSGSMAPEQASLAQNFGSFIAALKTLQAARAASGLDPVEVHVAITTSSVFEGWVPSPGTPTCSGQPLQCAVARSHNSGSPTANLCTDPNDKDLPCEDLVENYYPSFNAVGCTAGVATENAAYPQGSFVAAAGNPRLLHFTKDVWAGTPDADAKLAQLSTFFQQNINVGTCGSGMEQHFEAGRLAVEKALAGTQPNVGADEWPHAGTKLVVVWLGDEDDCSNPNDPAKALAFTFATQAPGNDVCTADQTSATHKMFALDRYASYFTGLGRSFGAAFIYSSDPTSCKDDGNGNRVCTPGTCICQCPASCTTGCGLTKTGECQLDLSPGGCSGKNPPLAVPGGSRFAELSSLFRAKGVNTFEASVCDANWGTTMQGIAQLVKP